MKEKIIFFFSSMCLLEIHVNVPFLRKTVLFLEGVMIRGISMPLAIVASLFRVHNSFIEPCSAVFVCVCVCCRV